MRASVKDEGCSLAARNVVIKIQVILNAKPIAFPDYVENLLSYNLRTRLPIAWIIACEIQNFEKLAAFNLLILNFIIGDHLYLWKDNRL